MTTIRYAAMPTEVARAFQDGAVDAYALPPERHVSPGGGLPCRHCLAEIEAGEEFLILAWRPFSRPQPYAETGPIFLHARHCNRHAETGTLPAMYQDWDALIVRGYSADERIIYGSGAVTPAAEVDAAAARLLARPKVAFVDLRSAQNNCFQCRVVRA